MRRAIFTKLSGNILHDRTKRLCECVAFFARVSSTQNKVNFKDSSDTLNEQTISKIGE